MNLARFRPFQQKSAQVQMRSALYSLFVADLANESDEMNTVCIFVRLEENSVNPHGHFGSMRIKATKQQPLRASHRRLSFLAMVTMLAAAFGFNPAVHAEEGPAASEVQAQVQSVGSNSTQEGNSWKQSDC